MPRTITLTFSHQFFNSAIFRNQPLIISSPNSGIPSSGYNIILNLSKYNTLRPISIIKNPLTPFIPYTVNSNIPSQLSNPSPLIKLGFQPKSVQNPLPNDGRLMTSRK